MPIFMDLHIGQGMTAEFVAKVHLRDLAVQDKFKCKCLTYWIDEERGNSYCLIEAPNKEAVSKMHWNAHKQFPEEIIKVDKRIVKAFLGRLHDPEVVDYMIDQKIKVFNDPAFRVILNIQTKDATQLASEIGKVKGNKLLSKCSDIAQNCITKHNGVAAESKVQEIVASFDSAIPAALCALEIRDFLSSSAKKMNLRISLHAGNPVDNDPELFGNTLRLGRFLNIIPKHGGIVISSIVKQILDKSSKNRLANFNLYDVHYLSATDQEFLIALANVFNRHWQDPDFDVDDCTKAMSLSKSKLYRQSMNVAGVSTARLLMEFRLRKANQMLLGSNKNIAETAFGSGFNSASYFSKCFHKRFGIQPIRYLKR